MSFYFKEKEYREELIKNHLKKIGYTSSDFATYIYAENKNAWVGINYTDLINDLLDQLKGQVSQKDLVDQIFDVMRSEEEYYINAWNNLDK
tara:strand:- start:20341 stop:20613 length:273 start_codon:yes stop_codon:yes gene_type:complete